MGGGAWLGAAHPRPGPHDGHPTHTHTASHPTRLLAGHPLAVHDLAVKADARRHAVALDLPWVALGQPDVGQLLLAAVGADGLKWG